MKLTVNGTCREFTGSTAAQLLDELGVDAARAVIEHNRTIVPREDLAATVLADGDVIEIVHFVSGG